jgi:DNA-binding NtrC family response regulator
VFHCRGEMTEKILIIDDDVDTLRLVGFDAAKTGLSNHCGFEWFAGVGEGVRRAPRFDSFGCNDAGYGWLTRLPAVCVRIRQRSAMPILMFTAKTQLDDKVAGFEVGADDYLTKPTHPTELQAHVKALLAFARSERSK